MRPSPVSRRFQCLQRGPRSIPSALATSTCFQKIPVFAKETHEEPLCSHRLCFQKIPVFAKHTQTSPDPRDQDSACSCVCRLAETRCLHEGNHMCLSSAHVTLGDPAFARGRPSAHGSMWVSYHAQGADQEPEGRLSIRTGPPGSVSLDRAPGGSLSVGEEGAPPPDIGWPPRMGLGCTRTGARLQVSPGVSAGLRYHVTALLSLLREPGPWGPARPQAGVS